MERKTLRVVLLENIEKAKNREDDAVHSALRLAERDGKEAGWSFQKFVVEKFVHINGIGKMANPSNWEETNLLLWFAYWLGREQGKDATYSCLLHTLKDKTERDPRTYH